MRGVLLALFAVLITFPAFAQDDTADSKAPEAAVEQTEEAEPDTETEAEEGAALTYSPDYCEFTVKFPEAPYKSRRCEDDEKTRCYDLVSYTRVYELSSTVNFRVICNPVDKKIYKDYSAEVMEATVRAMTKKSVVSEYNSSFREAEGYKQAGLVGQGKVGNMPTIYIAQLWIGKQSAFSVEAELIGDAHDAADTLFSDVLKTIRYTGVKEIDQPAKTVAPQNN